MGAVAYAIQLLGVIPQLIAAGKDVAALIKQGQAALSDMQSTGRAPTDAEWDALDATVKALRDELHRE